jgi:hypothetical protein
MVDQSIRSSMTTHVRLRAWPASFFGWLLLAGAAAAACGGGQAATAGASTSSAATPGTASQGATAATTPAEGTAAVALAPQAGGTTAVAPQPAAAPAPPPPPEHPFAATSLEATNLIDAAIDARASGLVKCVEAARPKRKNPHAKILVEVGLDQEGHLLGVKAPPGAPADPDLYACAQAALQGANFPRSHAGIITVVKSFEEQAVYR